MNAMIFPGMDPYLEDPQLWTGLHTRLIVYICNYLQALIRPRYIAAIEERVFLEGPEKDRIPDVWVYRRKRSNGAVAVVEADTPIVVKVPELEVHQTYVTILDRLSGQKLVTVIEVVSPSNKYEGPGRESYLAKQEETRGSKTHLVEIDLLRTGPHVLAVPEWMARAQGPYDYLTSVNRARGTRDEFDLYPTTLRERLPKVAIPLAGKDPDVVLDLQAVLEKIYTDGVYAERIKYGAPCRPVLGKKDRAWAEQILSRARKRPRQRTHASGKHGSTRRPGERGASTP
jgi:hypothetical protein